MGLYAELDPGRLAVRRLWIKIPLPTDAANAPPNLYTAIQEQLGLKLEATKALTDVLVIDKVEKPSEN